MSIAKTIEISSESKTSFEDAIKSGIEKAEKSLKNVQSAWIKEQKVAIANGSIEAYRVIMKVTFVLE
jgi:flavin-binding protein dodecin